MIEANEIFLNEDTRLALWAEMAQDTNEIALLADKIVQSKTPVVSVPPEMVKDIWTYLEKTPVEIFTRFSFVPLKKNFDNDMDDLIKDVSKICKSGADGVQLFVKMRDFYKFMDVLSIVRNDLFFNHKLSICMDIEDIDINDLSGFFQKLNEVQVDSFGLTFYEDMENRSDFIGRIYALLEQWNFNGELHFILLDNLDRVDQVVRLTEILQPDLISKTKFFF